MLRLITYRWVRLALAAAAVTAIVVVVLRLRRSSAAVTYTPGVAPRGVPAAGAGRGPAPRRPPPRTSGAPAGRALPSRAPAPRRRPPARPPSTGRRRAARWGALVGAVCLLAAGAQALEGMTFSKEAVTSEPAPDSCLFGPGRGAGETVEGGGPACRWGEAEVVAGTGAGTGSRAGTNRAGLRVVTSPESVSPTGSPAEGDLPAEVPRFAAIPGCRPPAALPRARPAGPKVVRAVNRQWARIERWLAANAPATRRLLAPPARARTIAAAERQMGMRLPGDLRASLLRHDGLPRRHGAAGAGVEARSGLLSGELLGVRAIRDTWRALCGLGGDGGGAAPSRAGWRGRMIPFKAEGGGAYLVADPAGRGVGRIRGPGGLDMTPEGRVIRSYYALLKQTADTLEAGGAPEGLRRDGTGPGVAPG
ncbi:hypothetical protein GCM10017673_02920 [Streptosporangium violaceochromogenes]|nr:hypothetical protein GCM10017673_02920 [Streptosporangium violaceochromogenes]